MISGLQIVMSAILKSMASLLQISLLIGFVIVIFAIVNLTFLLGKFHYTCFKNATEPFQQECKSLALLVEIMCDFTG